MRSDTDKSWFYFGEEVKLHRRWTAEGKRSLPGHGLEETDPCGLSLCPPHGALNIDPGFPDEAGAGRRRGSLAQNQENLHPVLIWRLQQFTGL